MKYPLRDNLAYQATIGAGITEEALVPFHYVGVKDTVDFRQIPWRGGRFDAAELEERVIRSERMDRLWSAMQAHPADRTLVFCVSRRHALFTRDWLISKGVSSAAVFSGEGSDSYGESLQRLRTGQLQALCVVDMFNEGLDIPLVDRVVMLRPTESKIIFLQQLGRGLRAAEGKTRLLVIDFVGNHRIFAQRIVHLLSLRGTVDQWRSLKDWLSGKPADLPPGCLLDVALDAKDMPGEIGWLSVPNQKLTKGMFAARVTGQSMQPRIPSDSWCLFRRCPAGSREGRLILVQLNTHTGPEDGGRYTVKRYHSTKQTTDEGWQHTTVELQPLNPDYQPIQISPEHADDLRIIGEFVSVIDSPKMA